MEFDFTIGADSGCGEFNGYIDGFGDRVMGWGEAQGERDELCNFLTGAAKLGGFTEVCMLVFEGTLVLRLVSVWNDAARRVRPVHWAVE